MMLRRKRKLRLPRKRLLIIYSCLLCLVIGGGILAWLLISNRGDRLVSPLPQGVFRLLPRTENQKETEIKTFLKDHDLVTDTIKRSSDSAIIVTLKDNGDVYLSDERYREELPSLQRIVSQLTMEGKRFKRLDLRFERPIIVL